MKERKAYGVWGVLRIDTTTVEKESDLVESFALTFAERIHQFAEWCGTLDLEEDLIVVIRDLDIEVLADRSLWLLTGSTRASILVRSRHLGGY